MDLSAGADLAWPTAAVFARIRDLSGYPAWLGVVQGAAPDPGAVGTAWLVDLGARLGPVRRAKRVRMVRVVDDAPCLARFERVETDGRSHSAWVLAAEVEPAPLGSRLTMHLHYGGRAWMPLAELALREDVRRAGARLDAVLRAGA